jgi:hypothetical protein
MLLFVSLAMGSFKENQVVLQQLVSLEYLKKVLFKVSLKQNVFPK